MAMTGQASRFVILCAAAASLVAAEEPPANELKVLKTGDLVLIRSTFSPDRDLVVRLNKGSNGQINFAGTRLVAPSAAMGPELSRAGVLIHNSGDDTKPWFMEANFMPPYGGAFLLGGNHGSQPVRAVTSPNHGRTVADIGSAWLDGAGTRFTLIRVADSNELWFLSENTADRDTNAVWRFTLTVAGTVLTRASQTDTLAVAQVTVPQLRPCCRIAKQEYRADGTTPLPDGQVVPCGFLEIVDDHDIIDPGSVLRDVIAHPGVESDFASPRLDAMVAHHIVYRFYPNGAAVIEFHARVLKDFSLRLMGFFQTFKLHQGDFDTHEFYIPKTVPFEFEGRRFDFKSLQDFTAPRLPNIWFDKASRNIESPDNLPDRLIQFLGRNTGGAVTREVGYVMGYSLVRGITRPSERSRRSTRAALINSVGKSALVAVDRKMGPRVPAGTDMRAVVYRQYFKPGGAEAPTCLYWHPEGEAQVVYADYHRSVERDRLRLPEDWAGRPLTLVEKTPSATLHSDRVDAQGAVEVTVSNGYGYVVFLVPGTTREPADRRTQGADAATD